MSKKTYILIGFALVILITLLTIWSPWSPRSSQTIVGAILPLTGDFASHGRDAQRGVRLAVRHFNDATNDQTDTFKLVVEDDQMSSRLGVSAFHKLVQIDHAKAIVGGIGSAVALTIAPLAQEYEVLLMSPTASHPSLSNAGPYFFRLWPSDSYEGTRMADYATQELRLERCAVLFINNDFGLAIKDAFSTGFLGGGGEVVAVESYTSETTDFRAQITKIMAFAPDCVYLAGYYADVAAVLKQSHQLGLETQFLAPAPVENQKLIELAGSTAEALLYTRPTFDPTVPSAEYQLFNTSYRDEFDSEPGIAAAYAYDATNILLAALSQAGSDVDGARQLLQTTQYTGVTGDIAFDGNGDVIRSFSIFTIRNSKFEPHNR